MSVCILCLDFKNKTNNNGKIFVKKCIFMEITIINVTCYYCLDRVRKNVAYMLLTASIVQYFVNIFCYCSKPFVLVTIPIVKYVGHPDSKESLPINIIVLYAPDNYA